MEEQEERPRPEDGDERWSEDDPAMAKRVRAQRKRRTMKVDGASVKTMQRVIGDRARHATDAPGDQRGRRNP